MGAGTQAPTPLCPGASRAPAEAVTVQGPRAAAGPGAGAAHGVAGSGCCGRRGGSSQPRALSPGAGGECIEALPAPWHPRRLRPCRTAPASRHRGNSQDLAALRASSSIRLRLCLPVLPSLPVPSLPNHPAGDTAQDDARGQRCLRGASDLPAPGASSKRLPEPAQRWDCGGPPGPSQEQGCPQGCARQEDGGDAQGR